MNLTRLANLQRLPRDKADTLLLLASALLVLAPHTLHLPLWVSLLCGATLVAGLIWAAVSPTAAFLYAASWMVLSVTASGWLRPHHKGSAQGRSEHDKEEVEDEF